MAELLSSSEIRVGAVRGRYFRENFAQGGIDLVQIVPELVTNADAAIAASGREHGRIELRFGAPDAAFMAAWRAQMRALRVPALSSWRFEVRCADDGVGVDAAAVDRRLGVLGELPDQREGRGLFGRGLRDVWLAQGAGRIEGVRDGRAVESWFFPAAGDDPYAYVHVRDEPAPGAASGTQVTVPLATERLPPDGRLRALVSQLVQLRPVLEDPRRELWLELPSGSVEVVRAPSPEPDPERPVLFDDDVVVEEDGPFGIGLGRGRPHDLDGARRQLEPQLPPRILEHRAQLHELGDERTQATVGRQALGRQRDRDLRPARGTGSRLVAHVDVGVRVVAGGRKEPRLDRAAVAHALDPASALGEPDVAQPAAEEAATLALVGQLAEHPEATVDRGRVDTDAVVGAPHLEAPARQRGHAQRAHLSPPSGHERGVRRAEAKLDSTVLATRRRDRRVGIGHELGDDLHEIDPTLCEVLPEIPAAHRADTDLRRREQLCHAKREGSLQPGLPGHTPSVAIRRTSRAGRR